jgi:calcium-dependent protein kinase
MGIVTNIVGCDCLRKEEEVFNTENDSNSKNKHPQIYTLMEEKEIIGSRPHSNSQLYKLNIPVYFDGKIDVKDYIQKGDKDSLENYQKIKRIGKGSYGSVYKVMKKNTNIIRAMKVMPKNFQKNNQEILREIDIIKNLDHPNVMKIFEFLEDEKNYYLIEEFCDGGDLDTILNGKKVYCEFLVKFIMYQVLLAINYLHSNNIVHQDIKKKNITIISLEENEKDKKSNKKKEQIIKKFQKLKTEIIEYNSPIITNDNIFITINEDKEVQEEFKKVKNIKNLSKKAQDYLNILSKTEVKVIDFGEALFMAQKKTFINDISGTIIYLSPELINGQMTKEIDEWACGVLMYYLLVGRPPFDGKTEDEIFDAIQSKPLDLNVEELKNVSNECKDLISKLLERDITKRIMANNALEHSFFKTGIKMKKLFGGMETKQTEKVLDTWIRLQNTHKRPKTGMFKKAVIAYMALNFVEKEEEKKMKNLFYKLSNGDDKFQINKENFAKTIKEVNANYTDSEIDILFHKLDENENGVIEYEELVRGFSDREKLLSERNMKEAFNFFDKDKDGSINWEEISKVVFQNKKMPKIFMKEFLEEIEQEKGKDVNITFEDFCKIIKSE